MRWITLFLLSCLTFPVIAQLTSTSYQTKAGDTHLLGLIERPTLEAEPFQKWFKLVYDRYEVDEKTIEKINSHHQSDIKVKIYLGTWCGDSKREVTRFLKIVDHSDVAMSAIEMIGLDNRSKNYKQGPNGEEKDLSIHRVPTFIFYQDGAEIGRIVESPSTSLEKDIAQIYAGLNPEPNYQVANRMLRFFQEKTIAEVDTFFSKNAPYFRYKVKGESELNTLGYVLLAADAPDKAAVAFKLNTLIFPNSGNAFDSLGEAHMKLGDYPAAVENYMRSYQLNPENTNAIQMVQEMVALVDGKNH